MDRNYFTLQDVIKSSGVPKTTFLRWEKEGKLPEGSKDARGWRFYTGEQYKSVLAAIKRLQNAPVVPEVKPRIFTLADVIESSQVPKTTLLRWEREGKWVI